MTGAESLVATAVAAGVEVCFANPGTTEMPFVAAMDTVRGLRPVLCLFEGVATGAADGYARMRRKPALTLLHLGPGFANGIANLHNARRAGSPVVNIVGQNPTWHLHLNAPLATDIAALARSVSPWVRMTESATALSADTASAIEAALSPPGQVATLIVPYDCALGPASGAARPCSVPQPRWVAGETVARAAELLRRGAPSLLLLGKTALSERGLRAAARVRSATACRVMVETFTPRLERGRGLPAFDSVPYFPEHALPALEGLRHAVLAGAEPPVSFFGYPGYPGELLPAACERFELGTAACDLEGALEELADRVGPSSGEANEPPRTPPERPRGKLTTETLGAALAAVQPEGAIVVNEAVSSGFAYARRAPEALPHSVMVVTGGAIGMALPCAAGAALACPERKVIAFQADGGGMYTLQALWTMAREGLDVTVLICANRAYRILRLELERAGVTQPGPSALELTDLSHPEIDWVALSRGMGVPAVRVEKAEDLTRELERSVAEPGPALIEAVVRET